MCSGNVAYVYKHMYVFLCWCIHSKNVSMYVVYVLLYCVFVVVFCGLLLLLCLETEGFSCGCISV